MLHFLLFMWLDFYSIQACFFLSSAICTAGTKMRGEKDSKRMIQVLSSKEIKLLSLETRKGLSEKWAIRKDHMIREEAWDKVYAKNLHL